MNIENREEEVGGREMEEEKKASIPLLTIVVTVLELLNYYNWIYLGAPWRNYSKHKEPYI